MKKLIQNIILIIIITIAILFSYAFLQNKIGGFRINELYHFIVNDEERHHENADSPKYDKNLDNTDSDSIPYRAVWLSYLEFNAYRKSVKKNDETTFRKFFQRVLSRSKKCGFNHIIVHVRPFADALYRSKYYPWAACISGTQGVSPGYDPLKIMVEMAHAEQIALEAWINPYRISSGNSLDDLSDENPAKVWAVSQDSGRNVLQYENALYYNPASEEVQKLICNGVREIVSNYEVDGIHMDDYFYPAFTEQNAGTDFDAPEYNQAVNDKTIDASLSIADWRRGNVNRLVSKIYQTIKSENPDVSFGISPAGNLSNLRSDLEYYVDIDTWVKEGDYVDYLMPQIYWGFTHDETPFSEILQEWSVLTDTSNVKLYIGIQLYRMGTTDKSQPDYEELQDPTLIDKELKKIGQTKKPEGYCLFSYQYLDAGNKKYEFDSNEFGEQRKHLLKKIYKRLKK